MTTRPDAVNDDAVATTFGAPDPFAPRHIGPSPADLAAMCQEIGVADLEALLDEVVPRSLRSQRPLQVPDAAGEARALAELRALAASNQVLRSMWGQGYYDTLTPAVIRRNILENPGWYTQYTPYQAEISQGRLEMLLHFQTLVAELTGLPVANASLLDEATAAAEAVAMMHRLQPATRHGARVWVDDGAHPQTIAVVRTRAEALGLHVSVAPPEAWQLDAATFGAILQSPTSDGRVRAVAPWADACHQAGVLLAVACDPLAQLLLRAPGAAGADIAFGSMQRFGVPMGFGGPHAAFFACADAHKRQMPGRLIGVSIDSRGKPALRMALQTREQHIRRNKATSNICTAQVLLAIIATAYAIYHGPDGLRRIATRVRALTLRVAAALRSAGHEVTDHERFDTIRVSPRGVAPGQLLAAALAAGVLLRDFGDGTVGVSLDETTTSCDLELLGHIFGLDVATLLRDAPLAPLPAALGRDDDPLRQDVFHRYRSETGLVRYLGRLQSRDLSLVQAMIPLGSCTMKLNAAAEMEPISWPGFAGLHPYAPLHTAPGYQRMADDLRRWLADITGFAATSLQPNAGSQGEYAGLLAIRGYLRAQGAEQRTVCLIPTSAHGTNPASAVMAGFEVVAVECDSHGNIDLGDLDAKIAAHAPRLGALMVTYPSTHGVFEEPIRDICAKIHAAGGQVYMDGANMNAMVGLVRPGEIGADVCHLNLHKTFAIPHGGGGPGMGPICVAAHLAPFLPGHPLAHDSATGPVSAAPLGSASILPISWMYIRMLGPDGLRQASAVAIAAANYVAARLQDAFPVLYRGAMGRVAHECILDLRPLKRSADVSVDDVAKRLIDYGFHGPTMSWPVAGTLMVEPTESEPLTELRRFCDAMLQIRAEVAAVEDGTLDRLDNPLRNAPHPADVACADVWPHSYPRIMAVFPTEHTRAWKFWPAVGRVDNAYGDRNLVCTCPTVEEFVAGV